MRISTHQAFLAGLQGLLEGQANVTRLQEQIATGKRVDTPGDDPVAAPQIIALKRQIELINQYKKNADTATNRLQLEETTLGSIENTLQGVRQLAIQAGDGALDQNGREAIAAELQQRVEELLGLVNTRGVDSEYLFSGYQADTQPFVRNASGGFSYRGDEGQLFLPVATDLNLAVNDSGKALFMGIPIPNDFTMQADPGNGGSAVAQNAAVINQADFDAFYPDDAVITFSVAGGTTTYSVTRVSDGAAISGGTPPQPLTNMAYTPGEAIAFEGMQLEITGTPADGDVFTAVHANPQKLDMLGIVDRLAQGLVAPGTSPAEYGELISDALISLDNVLSSINRTVAQIGSRLNTIESVQEANADIKLMSQNTLSKVEDLDFTEAISQLTQGTFILQAAQQSYAAISNLSLFNFIRS